MKRALSDPIFAAIIAIGVVLSIVMAVSTHTRIHDEATRWLDERAQLIARATEDTVDETFADLRATASFLSTVENVSQADFDEFVQRMGLNPGIIGIGLIDVVAREDLDAYLENVRRDIPGLDILAFDGKGGVGSNYTPRETYYLLRYASGGPFLDVVISQNPISTEADMLGFELSTESTWFAAASRTLAAPYPALTDLVDLGGGFEEKAFGVMHPMLDDKGNVTGLLIAAGLEMLLTSDLDMGIDPNVSWTVDNTALDNNASDWPVWRRDLDLPGSKWTLTVEPIDGIPGGISPISHWLALAIGLALTGALASTERQIQLRREEHVHVDQLRQLAEDKDRFLATVSHELRTPLTVVIGLAAELAQNGEFDAAERTELLTLIDKHGQEAGAIVEDLLVAARSDIDKLTILPERVDLSTAIPIALAASTLERAPIIGDLPAVLADPSRLQQILRNLLTNAHRYGGPDVEIRVSTTETHAVIAVADSGQPIPAEQEQAIFDPYVSIHERAGQLGSIGLGLFISRKLARLMTGDLRYRHDGTHGLFELALPLAEPVTAGNLVASGAGAERVARHADL